MYSSTLARLFAAVGVLALAAGTGPAEAQTIRAVMHSDLKILDPIWTTAYIVRNHGYMIYDTLLSMDGKFIVQPQMAEKWEVSADKLTYTFTLREGLLWHDGKPVTSEDVIASIKRWGAKDSMGQKLLSFTREMKAVNDRTFELILKEPYGLVLESLGKPSSNVPFIMPKRVAETPASEQISDFIGSGPFVFKRDEWKPGDKTVYVKFDKYKPRSEPASGLAGGKKVNVERVEWLAIPDHQTAVNALLAGEIDFIEAPPHDLLPVLKGDDSIKLVDWNPLGNQYMFRFNWLHKPFDNQKIRQAVAVAFSQEPFVKAVIGDPAYYKVCKAMFVCGTPLASEHGMERYLNGNIEEAKKLLKESGYDGTPVVLMHSTDLNVLTNLAPVAADMMRRMGLNVDMQSMDWQTLVARRAKKDPPSQGGWNAFLTSWVSADIMNPIAAAGFATNCDKAWFGWPCDEKMEQLRDQYARETDPAKQKQLAAEIQARAMEIGTHINVGQWYQAAAMRKGVIDNMLVAPAPVFWNMTKKG
ncbi:MAG: ABC transporter substrate-binding protein [Rhodospirillales bacterium]|nr:ABC transporter substrate-binding protein [Rhodospirillales bacterium]